MRLEIVNGLVSFVGKTNEKEKIEKTLRLMAAELGLDTDYTMDNSYDDEMDLGIIYDMDEWRVEDCKSAWRKVRKQA